MDIRIEEQWLLDRLTADKMSWQVCHVCLTYVMYLYVCHGKIIVRVLGEFMFTAIHIKQISRACIIVYLRNLS